MQLLLVTVLVFFMTSVLVAKSYETFTTTRSARLGKFEKFDGNLSVILHDDVCVKVLNAVMANIPSANVTNILEIEDKISLVCGLTGNLTGNENRFCHYVGAFTNFIGHLEFYVIKPLSMSMPVEKVCERIRSEKTRDTLCLKVMSNIMAEMLSADATNAHEIAERIRHVCRSLTGKENRFCYYIGAFFLSQDLSIKNKSAENVCRKLQWEARSSPAFQRNFDFLH